MSRSPHGERGLKCDGEAQIVRVLRSLSSWRAWIEIAFRFLVAVSVRSLSSWRAWIEIARPSSPKRRSSRSPHGERGLKLFLDCDGGHDFLSLSSWRAWIEITTHSNDRMARLSLSSWRAWIEIHTTHHRHLRHPSLSSWRAWIEISTP